MSFVAAWASCSWLLMPSGGTVLTLSSRSVRSSRRSCLVVRATAWCMTGVISRTQVSSLPHEGCIDGCGGRRCLGPDRYQSSRKRHWARSLDLLPKARVSVVENGRDHPRRWSIAQAAEESRKERRILTFGHHASKRPQLVIEAASLLGSDLKESS